jgi:hypothetical protein
LARERKQCKDCGEVKVFLLVRGAQTFDHDFDAHLTAEVVFCQGDEGVEGLAGFEVTFKVTLVEGYS